MTPKLKPETRAHRTAQIRQAALACFARRGYHQTTMDEIVRESGLSKGGVYGHFRSKQELFIALVESTLDLSGLLRSVVEAESTATGKLRAMFRAFERFAETDDFHRLVPLLLDVWVQNRNDQEINSVVQRIYDRAHDLLEEIIGGGIATGEFRPIDADGLARVLTAIFDGLLVQWALNQGELDWAASFAVTLSVLESGLRPSPATSPAKERHDDRD